MSMSVQGLASG